MGFFGKSKNQKLLDAAKSGDVTAAREALVTGLLLERGADKDAKDNVRMQQRPTTHFVSD